jgi:hypothetical protein
MIDFILVKDGSPEPFESSLDAYRSLVEQIEEGYGMCLSEYTNDLHCRTLLQKLLEEGYDPGTARSEQMGELDDRLRALLVPTTGSIHGSYPSDYFWFYGVPRNAPEVLEEARSLRAIA